MQMTGKYQSAYLRISAPSTNGQSNGTSGEDTIHFPFNPKEFTVERTAEWRVKPSKKASMPEFTGTKPGAVTLEMFLDASDGGDVTGLVKKLFNCVSPDPKTTRNKPSPPFVSFGWGSSVYLEKAIVKSVSVKYTRFRADGTPIRAIATVHLEELRPAQPGQNPTSGSLEGMMSRTVASGDTLPSIAYQELGSADLWRPIARINGIADPLRIRPGCRLIIPSPTTASRI